MDNVTLSISDNELKWKTVVRRLWLVFPPVVVAIGTVGNILCFLVTRRRSLRKTSVGLCLSVLALADLMVLLTGVTRNWTIEMFDWDIRDVHESLCKLHRYLLYFSLDYSAWVLVIITVERFVSVCYPFQAARLCTLKTTRRILAVVAGFICAENVGVLIVKGKEYDKNTNKTLQCGYTSEDGRFYWNNIRPWCVIALYAIIPFTIMIVCGTRIITRLYNAKKVTKRMESFRLSSKSHHHKLLRPSKRWEDNGETHNANDQRMNLASTKMYSVTFMTVVIACVFLLLVTPSHLEFFLEKYWDKNNTHDYVTFRLIEASSRTLLYTYHAIPFFVYCASGRQFRREFVALIKRQKSDRGYTYTMSGNTSMNCSPAVIRRSTVSATHTRYSPVVTRISRTNTSKF